MASRPDHPAANSMGQTLRSWAPSVHLVVPEHCYQTERPAWLAEEWEQVPG